MYQDIAGPALFGTAGPGLAHVRTLPPLVAVSIGVQSLCRCPPAERLVYVIGVVSWITS